MFEPLILRSSLKVIFCSSAKLLLNLCSSLVQFDSVVMKQNCSLGNGGMRQVGLYPAGDVLLQLV